MRRLSTLSVSVSTFLHSFTSVSIKSVHSALYDGDVCDF